MGEEELRETEIRYQVNLNLMNTQFLKNTVQKHKKYHTYTYFLYVFPKYNVKISKSKKKI